MSGIKDVDAASKESKENVPTLNWRFEFGDYVQTRRFLDEMADLSKRLGYYPNVSFGKTYVNISIDAMGQSALAKDLSCFIGEMEAFAATKITRIDLQGER